MEEINIKEFLDYYRKYVLGVIIICLVAALGMLIYYMAFKTEKYSTSTSIVLVKNESTEKSDTIDQTDITLNQKLVSTYRHIIKSRLVLEQVINDLKLGYTYNQISNEINVTAVEDTEIIKITVTDEDPELSVKISNKVAEVFAKEVIQLYNINNVSVLDSAQLPTYPSNYHTVRDIVLALLVAFVGSSAVIFVVFYFDDSLTDNENIEAELEMPVVAKVFKDYNNTDLIVDSRPNAATSECIRTLRTNLQFSEVDNELKTLLVTSTLPSEGKSFISANLATSFAQTGKSVLIIDCDLRKGRQHKIFKVTSRYGLSNLLISNINSYMEYVIKTKIENLSIIPRGVFPPNPSELLNSKKMVALLDELKKHFDIIILDGAPLAGISDSLILSSLVDKVLLIGSFGHTPKTELKNMKKSLDAVGAKVAGCVINNATAKKHGYGDYYYYYGYGEKDKKVIRK